MSAYSVCKTDYSRWSIRRKYDGTFNLWAIKHELYFMKAFFLEYCSDEFAKKLTNKIN